MDMFKIKSFFWELLKLTYTADFNPVWGNPCSYLLERMILRQEPFLSKIEGDFTNMSHEMRLNGAGLKLWWSAEKDDNDFRKFTCHIGGDQAKEYPMFVARARQLIKYYNFNRR